MVRPWTHHVTDTGLYYREADPADAEIDTFDCGDEPPAIEMRDFFRHRGWLGTAALGFTEPTRCLQFGTSTEIVGYSAIIVQDVPHPLRKSRRLRPYLLITQAAVDRRFQHVEDPVSHRRYAEVMFDALTSIAKELGCAGLYLNVRKENAQARRFYQRYGFTEDGEYRSARMNADMVRERL